MDISEQLFREAANNQSAQMFELVISELDRDFNDESLPIPLLASGSTKCCATGTCSPCV